MSTSQGTELIQELLTKIKARENSAIIPLLDQLPLTVISKDYADTLLSILLNTAMKALNCESVQICVRKFDLARIHTDPLPTIINLFLNPLLDREVLSFVLKCFPEKIPLDYYIDLVNMGDDETALKVAGILTTFFPNVPQADWNTLFHLTDNVEEEEYENQMLRAYFQSMAAKTNTSVVKPAWIRDLPAPTDLPRVPDTIPNVNEAVSLIIEDIKQHGICSSIESAKLYLISHYAISPVPEKIKLLAPMREIPPFDDTILFQEFGPVNTVYTLHTDLIDPEHECAKYGGCRMFLCKEYESMHKNGDEIDTLTDVECEDWFRKSCDKCLHKIRAFQYAVRRPLRHGGWQGCYCSFKCMESDIKDMETAVMVGHMKEQLKVLGIRER